MNDSVTVSSDGSNSVLSFCSVSCTYTCFLAVPG
nr:MAG TPA: hypothetical protein [Bacteriophage sp.]